MELHEIVAKQLSILARDAQRWRMVPSKEAQIDGAENRSWVAGSPEIE